MPILMAPPCRAGWLKIQSCRLIFMCYLFQISSVAQPVMNENMHDFPPSLKGSSD